MNSWFRRLFLVIAIGGGFTGFALTVAQFFQADQPVIIYLIGAAAIGGYAYGIYGGLALADNEPKGLVILSWYFLAQIPVLISPIVSYQFSSGLTLYATLGTTGTSWAAFFGSRWQVALLQLSDGTFALGTNFFAIWATWYLRKQLAKKIGASLPPPNPNEPIPPSPASAASRPDPGGP